MNYYQLLMIITGTVLILSPIFFKLSRENKSYLKGLLELAHERDSLSDECNRKDVQIMIRDQTMTRLAMYIGLSWDEYDVKIKLINELSYRDMRFINAVVSGEDV